MFRRLVTSAAVLALVTGSAWGVPTATLRMTPSVVVGSPGGFVDVPILISTPDAISIVRVTVDFNSSAATFVSARVGNDAPGFTIPAFNANLPFPPKSPGTNENVLVLLMSSSSGSVTGNNKELLVLRFQLASGACAMSPITFDRDCNHTDAATGDGLTLRAMVDGSCVVPNVPTPNLFLFGGAIANGCASDALAETIGLRLLPNTPNPFNPTTRLVFEKPFDGPATLEIVNVAGHRVRTLLAGDLHAGRHELIWDGQDAKGNRVAAGVYYARLQTPEATASRSLVLVQ